MSKESKGKEREEIHTDKDGKVFRLTYDAKGTLCKVEYLY